jgi:HTH-type transcriptional regulator/antitoxin HipB
MGGRQRRSNDREGIDAGAYIARARRLGDLSQRDLARQVGLAQSTVAGYESGARPVSLEVFARLLAAGGLRLAVVDAQGQPVDAFAPDSVRDNAGRRFPAHLDVQPPDDRPHEALRGPRYDRYPPAGWYHLRRARDQRAGVQGRPGDHPTVPDLELRRLRRRYGRSPSWPHWEPQITRALGLPTETPAVD